MGNSSGLKLTPFGIYVRKLRLDRSERLKDMAKRIGVSSTYLSSVERGRRAVPTIWLDKITKLYDLDLDEVKVLEKAIRMSRILHSNKLDVSHLSDADKFLIGEIVEALPEFTEAQRNRLRNLIVTRIK